MWLFKELWFSDNQSGTPCADVWLSVGFFNSFRKSSFFNAVACETPKDHKHSKAQVFLENVD